MRRALVFASTLVTLVAVSSAARAEFATPPGVGDPSKPPLQVAADPPRLALWVTPHFEGGVALLPSLVPGLTKPMGGFGRFSVELLAPLDTKKGTGPVFGVWYGFEGWGAPKIGGGSVPVLLDFGIKTDHFLGTLGVGVNAFTIDKLGEKYGGGLLSPRASARLGVIFDPVILMANADIQRRWQWGLDDLTVFQAGISIGFIMPDYVSPAPRRAR
ncbi:Hypothetical protein A7982_10661 [Minicystis rosea]|nr:Hypothetical protein A7982_10661 [Minicystis rosea]